MNMYCGSYWNNYRYPNAIVVVSGGERGDVIYGKRPTRGTTFVSDRGNVRSRTGVTNSVRNDAANSGGRISSQSRQAEYYNRYNTRQRSTGSSTYDNRSNTENNRSRSWDNSSWDNSYNNNRSINRSSSPTYSPSYSPSNSGGGTRTNSGGSSSSGRGRD